MRFLSARVSPTMPVGPLGWLLPPRECLSFGAMYRALPFVLSRSMPLVGGDESSGTTAFAALGGQDSVAAGEDATTPIYIG
jgi:hypothetical protein